MIQQRNINGSVIEIYINGGGSFITEAFPTNFHTLHSSRMLNNPAEIDKYKEVTAAERAQLEAQDAQWQPPSDVIVALWDRIFKLGPCSVNNTYGGFNKQTGFFEGNGLKDITTDQAVAIIVESFRSTWIGQNSSVVQGCYGRVRTLPPIMNNNIQGVVDSTVEVVRIVDYYIVNNDWDKDTSAIKLSNTRDAFSGCSSLKEVKGILQLPATETMGVHFYNSLRLVNLETIFLKNVSLDILDLFKASPKVSFASLSYAVKNSVATKQITITVHADVYSALNGNAAEYPFNGGSREQWTQLLQEAAEKQILFATA